LDYDRIQQSKLPRHLHHNEKRVVPVGNAHSHTYSYANAHTDSDRDSYSYTGAHTDTNSHSAPTDTYTNRDTDTNSYGDTSTLKADKIYHLQRALRAQAAKDFAALNNWQVSLTPFPFFALTPRHSVQPAITNYRRILFRRASSCFISGEQTTKPAGSHRWATALRQSRCSSRSRSQARPKSASASQHHGLLVASRRGCLLLFHQTRDKSEIPPRTNGASNCFCFT
jgi:hypothetical protein